MGYIGTAYGDNWDTSENFTDTDDIKIKISRYHTLISKYVKLLLNPLKPEFTVVICIHYKLRLAVDEDDLKWVRN